MKGTAAFSTLFKNPWTASLISLILTYWMLKLSILAPNNSIQNKSSLDETKAFNEVEKSNVKVITLFDPIKKLTPAATYFN